MLTDRLRPDPAPLSVQYLERGHVERVDHPAHILGRSNPAGARYRERFAPAPTSPPRSPAAASPGPWPCGRSAAPAALGHRDRPDEHLRGTSHLHLRELARKQSALLR